MATSGDHNLAVDIERGEPKIVVATQFGVSRQTLHTWLTRYAQHGLAGLIDRTHRPESCPHQADAVVETRVCELRREHPWWGPGGSLMSWPAPLLRAAQRRGNRRCIASWFAMA